MDVLLKRRSILCAGICILPVTAGCLESTPDPLQFINYVEDGASVTFSLSKEGSEDEILSGNFDLEYEEEKKYNDLEYQTDYTITVNAAMGSEEANATHSFSVPGNASNLEVQIWRENGIEFTQPTY